MKHSKANGGWTLIELLTVVAIISILFIGIAMVTTKQLARARDATRIADLKDTQVYLERFYIDNGASYPAATGLDPASDFADMAVALAGSYPEYDGGTSDPKNLDYTYALTSGGYCMCAEFESHGEKSNSTDAACTFSSVESDTTHYCLVNKQ